MRRLLQLALLLAAALSFLPSAALAGAWLPADEIGKSRDGSPWTAIGASPSGALVATYVIAAQDGLGVERVTARRPAGSTRWGRLPAVPVGIQDVETLRVADDGTATLAGYEDTATGDIWTEQLRAGETTWSARTVHTTSGVSMPAVIRAGTRLIVGFAETRPTGDVVVVRESPTGADGTWSSPQEWPANVGGACPSGSLADVGSRYGGGGGVARSVVLASNDRGDLAVAWFCSGSNGAVIAYAERPAGTAWSAPITLPTDLRPAISELSLALDGAGRPTIAFLAGGTNGETPAAVTRRGLNGQWPAPVALGASSRVQPPPSLILRPDGTPVVVWAGPTAIHAAVPTPGSTPEAWSDASLPVSPPQVPGQSVVPARPSVALSDGGVVVAWNSVERTAGDGDFDTYVDGARFADGWSPITRVTRGLTYAIDETSDALGNLYLGALTVSPGAPTLTYSLLAYDGSPPSFGSTGASVDVPATGEPGAELTMRATSVDLLSPLRLTTWDFGDGTPPVTTRPGGASTVTHTYATPGTYTVRITSVDIASNATETTRTITIAAAPTPTPSPSPEPTPTPTPTPPLPTATRTCATKRTLKLNWWTPKRLTRIRVTVDGKTVQRLRGTARSTRLTLTSPVPKVFDVRIIGTGIDGRRYVSTRDFRLCGSKAPSNRVQELRLRRVG